MKLGVENKKQLYFLVALVGFLALYLIYDNFLSGPTTPTPTATRTPAASTLPTVEADRQASRPQRAPSGRSEEFKPALRSKNVLDRPDLTNIDPTLRLDLLARLQDVPAPSGNHNLFQIGPSAVEVAAVLKGQEPKVPQQMYPPPLPPPPPPPQPVVHHAVPINVKYYGWAAPTGNPRRGGFFMDGDNIMIKYEGDTIKGHYRVVRIGPTAAVVEDNDDKLQQTLTKVEDSTP